MILGIQCRSKLKRTRLRKQRTVAQSLLEIELRAMNNELVSHRRRSDSDREQAELPKVAHGWDSATMVDLFRQSGDLDSLYISSTSLALDSPSSMSSATWLCVVVVAASSGEVAGPEDLSQPHNNSLGISNSPRHDWRAYETCTLRTDIIEIV